MSSRRKSTCNRRSKECHHSRNHRDKKCEGNSRGIVEPVYVTDSMPSHTNNVPVFFHAPFYGPSNSAWNTASVGYIPPPTLPVFPNVNQPTQLSIGPLYLLAEPIRDNSVIREGTQSVSDEKKKPMLESNERFTNVIKNEKTKSVNVIADSYNLRQGNEAINVVNTWKSQNRSKRKILIDTPTQYEYLIPTSNQAPSSSSKKLLLENSEGISEASYLTSIHSSESRSQLSEKGSSDMTFPEHPQGDLTVLRVVDMKEIDQGEELYDLNPPHTSRASKLHKNTRGNRNTLEKNSENPRIFSIQVPVGMNGFERERYLFFRARNGIKFDTHRISTKSDKPLNIASRNLKRNNVKYRNFRGMTTEDSINDLYEKIKAIQSTIGASSVNGFLPRQSDQEVSPTVYQVPFEAGLNAKQLRFYESDIPVPGTSTITRGISPINFRTSENNGSCCTCCQQCPCERNGIDNGQRFTRDMDTITDFPSSSSYYPETPNDGTIYAKIRYPQPDTFLNPDIETCAESLAPGNDPMRIVFDQEAECQFPSIPRIRHETYALSEEEINNRPCCCPENTAPDSYTKTSIACDRNESNRNGPNVGESDESRPSSVQRSTITSAEDAQFCICHANASNPCHCNLNKELCDIMDKIEDNIISKLERKKILFCEKPLEPSSPEIQDYRETRSSPVGSRQSDGADREALPTRLEGPNNTSASVPVILDNSEYVIQEHHPNPPRESRDSNRISIMREPRSTLRSQELRDSGIRNSELRHPRLRDSGYIEEGSYYETPHRSNSSLRSQNMRGSGLNKKRNPMLSSVIRRRGLRRNRREPPSLFPSLGPGRRYTSSKNSLHMSPGPIRGSGSSYRRRPEYADSYYNRSRYHGPSRAITDVFTAIPNDENDAEASKNRPRASKDNLKSEEIQSMSNTTIEKIEKDGRSSNSCQIKRMKLSGKRKHIYILVKKRKKAKKNSSQECQEMFTIATVRSKSPNEVVSEKVSVSKGGKAKKIHKIYL